MISASGALTCSYDYHEVVRSVVIAIAASYSALDLAGRVTATRGRARLAWLTGGAVAKQRAISSSVLANSEGRRAGNPKHPFPPSMAGSQKHVFSTGKQRNAVTGRPKPPAGQTQFHRTDAYCSGQHRPAPTSTTSWHASGSTTGTHPTRSPHDPRRINGRDH